MAELSYLRDVGYPFLLQRLNRLEVLLGSWSERTPRNEERAEKDLFSIKNSRKARIGGLQGLQDPKLMAQDREWTPEVFHALGSVWFDEAKYPQATACLVKDRAALLRFYDFPAEHWLHVRTTNPIESVFATVRLRHRKTKGSGSRVGCLAMVYKLMESASKKWRTLNGSTLLSEVVKGVVFVDGVKRKPAA
jgi:hypothetical protein